MNNATFAGNIGQDCRMNTVNTNNGQKSVCNFSLAVQKRQKDQQGNYLTLWVDCAVWGQRADSLSQYLTKGQKVTVSGTVDVDSYQNNSGQVIPKLTLMVNELTLMGSANQSGGGQNNQGGYQQTNQHQGNNGNSGYNNGNPNVSQTDDIPF